MKLKVYNISGTTSVEKDFPIASFEGDKGLLALKQAIVAYQANKRHGTHKTKTVAEVSGTGKKPFRQKGTGGARQGTLRAVHMRKGGISHGPVPRDYSQKLNRKLKQLALSRALFNRAASGEVALIERFEVAQPKTSQFATVLGKIAPAGRVLLVDDSWNSNAFLAARNIDRIEIADASDVNALDLCDYQTILMSEKGLEKIIARTNGGNIQ